MKKTKIHVFTHHKCGSTWLRRVLHAYAEKTDMTYQVFPEASNAKFDQKLTGSSEYKFCIYKGGAARYLSRLAENERGIHLLRDPRDAFVSQFWSWRNSHNNNTQRLLETREKLQELSVEEGLSYFLENIPLVLVSQLEGWDLSTTNQIYALRYENLRESFSDEIGKALSFCGLTPNMDLIASIEKETSFQTITKRKAGDEDVNSHLRKGIVGDWCNYLNGTLKQAFKNKYGDAVIQLGYESSNEW